MYIYICIFIPGQVLDYTDPGFLQSAGLTKFDVIVDCVGGDDYWQAFKGSLKADGMCHFAYVFVYVCTCVKCVCVCLHVCMCACSMTLSWENIHIHIHICMYVCVYV